MGFVQVVNPKKSVTISETVSHDAFTPADPGFREC